MDWPFASLDLESIVRTQANCDLTLVSPLIAGMAVR